MEFEMLGLQPRVVKHLKALGLIHPTPIQRQAIPHALNGRDIMGLAQTGTGKTAAFGLPIVNSLMSLGVAPEPKTATSLILAPTRELAKQIADALAAFTRGSHLKVAVVVGGMSINRQIETMRRGADLMIATPSDISELTIFQSVQAQSALSPSVSPRFTGKCTMMIDTGMPSAIQRTPNRCQRWLYVSMLNWVSILSRSAVVGCVHSVILG